MVKKLRIQAESFEQAMNMAQGFVTILGLDGNNYRFTVDSLPIGKDYEVSIYTEEGGS